MATKKFDFTNTLATIIFTGTAGFLNAYTIVRWNFMPTPNTGNLTRIGTALGESAMGESLSSLLPFIIPILGTIIGSFLATLLSFCENKLPNKSVQLTVLMMEIVCFTVLGLIPDSMHLYIALIIGSVLGGMQLTIFRKWGNLPHNTTIATGNMRSVGEFWAHYCKSPSAESGKKALSYTLMVMTWPVGAFLGTVATLQWSAPAIWICSVSLIVVFFSSRNVTSSNV